MIRNFSGLTTIIFGAASTLLSSLEVKTVDEKIVVDEAVYRQRSSNFDKDTPSYKLVIPVIWEPEGMDFIPNYNQLILDIENAVNVSRQHYVRYSITSNKIDIRVKVLDNEVVIEVNINYREIREKE